MSPRDLVAAMLAVVCLISSTPPTRAEGVGLSWDDCMVANTPRLRQFACDTNEGFTEQVASFVPPEGVGSLVRLQATWDACSMGVMWPAWWQFFNAGACRQSALSVSADFSEFTMCADPWQGAAIGGIVGYTIDGGTWDAVRLRVEYMVAEPIALEPDIEYYAFRIRIQHGKTIGTGACDGCTTPVCIVLNQIDLIEATGERHPLYMPYGDYSLYWQQKLLLCPFIVPARNATWGQVKSLYR